MKTKTAETVYEMQQIVLGAIQRLVEKKASVGETKAVIGGVNCVQAGLALRMEQARLTGSRVVGDVLPDLRLNPGATMTTVLTGTDIHQRKALRPKKKAA